MGLRDDFRPGRPRIQEDSENLRRRILERIDTPPPAGYSKWNGRTLGEASKYGLEGIASLGHQPAATALMVHFNRSGIRRQER